MLLSTHCILTSCNHGSLVGEWQCVLPLSIRMSGGVLTIFPPGWMAACSSSLYSDEWQCVPSLHKGERQCACLLSTQMSGSVLPHTAQGWATVCSPSCHLNEWQCAHPLATWMSGSVLTIIQVWQHAHPLPTRWAALCTPFLHWGDQMCSQPPHLGEWHTATYPFRHFKWLCAHQGKQQCAKECFSLYLIVSVISWDVLSWHNSGTKSIVSL